MDGNRIILYDDEDKKTLNMSKENWRYVSSVHSEVCNSKTLPNDEQRVIRGITNVFGKKPFLRHRTQAFNQFPLVNAYSEE